jgi:hypothetical protein
MAQLERKPTVTPQVQTNDSSTITLIPIADALAAQSKAKDNATNAAINDQTMAQTNALEAPKEKLEEETQAEETVKVISGSEQVNPSLPNTPSATAKVFAQRQKIRVDKHDKLEGELEGLLSDTDIVNGTQENDNVPNANTIQSTTNQVIKTETTKGVTEQIKQDLTNSNAKKKDSDQKLLNNVGNFLAANPNQQKDMLTEVNASLGKIKPLERDSLLTATTGVMSAIGNGVSVKSAAKAGGAVLGVGIVGTLGGCLAAAAAKAATASTGAGATVKELGDALKETMEQVFPEALIAIAAAALLAVIAKMVYDAMQNAAKNINSTDTKTRLYKAQEKMQKAQNDLASNPLDLKAHKAMESAIKDMIDLGSQKVFTDKNGKKMGDPQALLESDQLKSLKEALAKTTQLKNHAKLQVVYKLVHGDKKGAEDYKSSSKTQQFKNAFKPTTQTNIGKLRKLAMKMGIADKISASSTPATTQKATLQIQS